MNTTTLYVALGLLIATGYPTALLSHALVHILLFVRLPGAAAAVARNTATVNALLPAALDQLVGGPNLVTLAKDIDAASKNAPENVTLVAWALRAKKMAGLPLAALMLLLAGCSNYDALRSAVDISNGVAQLEGVAAPVLQEKCVRPMQLIAAEADTPERVAKAKALAKTCDPMIDAYDGMRRAHLLALQGIAQAETGGITVGAVFALVERLTESAAALEKEITQP
jgi:hypothetical protein